MNVAALATSFLFAGCAAASKVPAPPAPLPEKPVSTGPYSPATDEKIHTFDHEIREASGAVYLPGPDGQPGKFLLTGDEEEYPFYLLDEGPDGSPVCRRTSCIIRSNDALSDLEGITRDPDTGWIYAITSHSMNRDGERKGNREKLVRFKLEGSAITSVQVRTGILDTLTAHPVIGELMATASENPPGDGGIDIEGLAWDAEKRWLWLGFRSPLGRGPGTECPLSGCEALLLPVTNVRLWFEKAELRPEFGKPLWLELGGLGVRDLAIVPELRFFMITAGATRDNGPKGKFVAALRDGTVRDFTQKIPSFPQLDNPEGIAVIRPFTSTEYFFVTDNGNASPSTWLLGGLTRRAAASASE